MNIIDERDKRTIYRKLRKKEYDDILTLSVERGQTVRLLDEGMVVDAYGGPLFYIKKGTLQAFYDSLADDYVGSINIGHTDLATFPERIVGKWTKADLSLVDIGDGRKGLDVNLSLMEDHPLVKALRMMPFSLGVSAEFGYHVDQEASETYQLEILDAVNIYDFAIVGEAGNVNSSGIALKGGNVLAMEKKLSEVFESADLAEINKKLDALLETPADVVTPEIPEEVPTQEEAPVEEPVAEEVTEEEAVEEAAPEETPEEEPVAEEEAVDLSVVLNTVEELKAEVEQLKADNASLQAQLSAKVQAEKDFVAKFKNLSISLGVEKTETKVEQKPVFTDGIGE